MLRKILQILLPTSLACLLITALVYFNFIDVDKKTQGTEIGDVIPNYSLYEYSSDEEYSFINMKYKVTFINFWGTWCGPCVKEMPIFNQLSSNYDVNVVAIHSKKSLLSDDEGDEEFKSEVQTFIDTHTDGDDIVWKDYNIHFLQDSDEDSVYTNLGGTSIYPMTYVLDESRVIRKVHSGSITYDTLVKDYYEYCH